MKLLCRNTLRQTVGMMFAAMLMACTFALSIQADTCYVDGNDRKQMIDGFGFSTAWCGKLPAAKNNALYGTLGMSMLRVRISETKIGDTKPPTLRRPTRPGPRCLEVPGHRRSHGKATVCMWMAICCPAIMGIMSTGSTALSTALAWTTFPSKTSRTIMRGVPGPRTDAYFRPGLRIGDSPSLLSCRKRSASMTLCRTR